MPFRINARLLRRAFFLLLAFLPSAANALPSGALPATPSVVLVLNLGSRLAPAKEPEASVAKMYEETFRSATARWPYAVHVAIDPSVFELRQLMASAQTHAVIWVGHASNSQPNAFVSAAGVVDARGTEVSAVLGAPHPNLRYLSVIGCRAKAIFDRMRAEGRFRRNPELRIDASADLDASSASIRYMPSLLQTLTTAHLVLSYLRSWENPRSLCLASSAGRAVSVVVRRRPIGSGGLSEAAVLASDRLVQVLPAAPAGSGDQTTIMQVEVPDHVSARRLNLVFKAPADIDQIERLGEIEAQMASVENEGAWSLFRSATGTPIGADRRLLLFSGPIPSTLEPLRFDGCARP